MVDEALTDDPPSGTGDPKSPRPWTLRPTPPHAPTSGQYRLSPLSWIVFLILVAWNIWSFLPTQTSQVALPYSAFKAQVAGGNVSQVRIIGVVIALALLFNCAHTAAGYPHENGRGLSSPEGARRLARLVVVRISHPAHAFIA
jgi:hypothetical protein